MSLPQVMLRLLPLSNIFLLDVDLIKASVTSEAHLHGQQLWTLDAAMLQKIPGCVDGAPVGIKHPQHMAPLVRVHAGKRLQGDVVDFEVLH